MFGRRSQRETSGTPQAPDRDPAYRRPGPPAPASTRPPDPAPRTSQPRGPERAGAEANDRTLIVGRGIALSGDIGQCDTLVVEGKVEAQLTDGRKLEVAETGVFKGTAAVDRAEIGGRLEGTVTVREHLLIRSTGRVEGTVRYGALAVERGGVVTGTAETLPRRTSSAPAAAESTAPDKASAQAS